MDTLQIGEILDCSVCFERLDQTCKVLPCQHTFCKSCLKAIVASRQELRCPECRCLVTEGVDELPGNILLIRLLEGLKYRKNKNHSPPPSSSKIPLDEPCARARFSYEPREPGDLALKKGDLVILIQQVDANWYIGEVSGNQGYLPANFVEVINPLPKFEDTDKPLAKGLYDFEEEDEEDLLHFKQGDVITVLKRVDVNWCEGEIGDRCGIFPLNFVELNRSAVLLINVKSSPEPVSQTRRQPNIPRQALTVRQHRRKAQPQKPVKRSRSIPRENSESFRRRMRDFGQSSVAGNQGNDAALDQTNRHSIEVASTERSQEFAVREDDTVALPMATANVAVRRRLNSRSNEVRETQQENSSAGSSTAQGLTNQAEVWTRDVQSSADLYIAVYNYRPQKSDELELCSGEHYKVIEKGADGWFKGFPVLVRHNVGHFPGNYVRPIRPRQSQWQNVPEKEVPLYQRRRNNSSQSSLNPEAAVLVLPRPRPFSDITADLNSDSTFSPPLTPPLVGAKPPKQGLLRRFSIGKKKDRSSPQTVLNDRGSNQQSDLATATVTASSNSRPTQLSSPRTRMDSRPGLRVYSVTKEKYRVTANYPPHNQMELELKCGDIVYVTKKTDNGWYHGTLERNGKVGFFPRSFVEKI